MYSPFCNVGFMDSPSTRKFCSAMRTTRKIAIVRIAVSSSSRTQDRRLAIVSQPTLDYYYLALLSIGGRLPAVNVPPKTKRPDGFAARPFTVVSREVYGIAVGVATGGSDSGET